VRIDYRRSGGFAGINMIASVDVTDLPAEEARVVNTLFSDPCAERSTPSVGGAPDQFSYELTITNGEQTSTRQWGEAQVPEAVRSLLATLAERAHPAPPG
jgi:hypothetical protein